MNRQQIVDLIDWDLVIKAPRYSGGHSEVMEAIFGDNASVLAFYREDDYQGILAYAYQFNDGTVVIITDSFGSCSGCDAWECCSDQDAKIMIQSLVDSARIFENSNDAREFCETKTDDAEHYLFRVAKYLKF